VTSTDENAEQDCKHLVSDIQTGHSLAFISVSLL